MPRLVQWDRPPIHRDGTRAPRAPDSHPSSELSHLVDKRKMSKCSRDIRPCPSCIPLAVMKHPGKGSSKEKGFIRAYSSRLQFITVGKSRQESEAATHVHSQEQKEMIVYLVLNSRSPIIQSRAQIQGMAPPTVG